MCLLLHRQQLRISQRPLEPFGTAFTGALILPRCGLSWRRRKWSRSSLLSQFPTPIWRWSVRCSRYHLTTFPSAPARLRFIGCCLRLTARHWEGFTPMDPYWTDHRSCLADAGGRSSQSAVKALWWRLRTASLRHGSLVARGPSLGRHCKLQTPACPAPLSGLTATHASKPSTAAVRKLEAIQTPWRGCINFW